MRVTLVRNPTAGDQALDRLQLRELLVQAGHTAIDRSTKGKWREALREPGDLVAVAGGDGAVRKVVLELAERGSRVPVAIIPAGTANNIARTLGLFGDASELIGSWRPESARPFDLGTLTVGGTRTRFAESFGGGSCAELIALGKPQLEEPSTLVGNEIDRALILLLQIVSDAPVRRWGVVADGVERSGEYLAVEVLNIHFVGPGVALAPEADPHDGQLDLVLVDEAHRSALVRMLEGRLAGRTDALPRLDVVRAARIELAPPRDVHFHLDDKPWPDDSAGRPPGRLEIGIDAGAVRVIG
jgi:diacylglycerol kinase (ATP)